MIHKKEFYFIRHGQTDNNVSVDKVDHADVSLNAVGLKQAEDLEPIIARLPIKSVCYSPMKRAKIDNCLPVHFFIDGADFWKARSL